MRDIEVIHADSQLLAVNKPAGLLTVPGIGPDKQDCLITRLQREFPSARIVHRLDRATSGVVLLALDGATHRALSRMFHDRKVEKTYIAVVAGVVEEEEGEIDLPLRKDLDESKRTATPIHIVDHEQGKKALTRWRVLERADSATRLELTPLTGRSHQIRVHLSAIGHPILGDDIYAPPHIRDAAPRLILHAESLELAHPTTNAPLHVAAPCPF